MEIHWLKVISAGCLKIQLNFREEVILCSNEGLLTLIRYGIYNRCDQYNVVLTENEKGRASVPFLCFDAYSFLSSHLQMKYSKTPAKTETTNVVHTLTDSPPYLIIRDEASYS